MLIEIRDRASSFVAYIIIGLLVLSFALWGIQEYFGGAASPPVAKVNKNEILPAEFNNQVQQYKQRLQSILGNNYRQQYPDDSLIKKDVINSMVQTELLRQAATKAGYRISDTSLIKRIQQIPQFQRGGKFDPELYNRLLQGRRYNNAQFENEMREQEKVRQMEISIVASSFMPKADLQRFQKISDQTRDFKYAIFAIKPEAVNVSDEEVEKYFDENQQLFRTPEQVKLAYIELKESDLIEQITFSADQAREIYDAQQENYMTDELRRARHILFKVPNEVSADAIEWDEALEKANEIVKQLDEGASFADLAKQNSEDSLSADKGGELGFFAIGDFTNKELEDVLFSLKVGKYSTPIRTEQGVQIIQLDEIQAPQQKAFEDVRDKIINERKSQLAQERFYEITEELANLVFELPDDLQEASETFDLQVKETDWLAANSTAEIFAYPKIQSLAFSENIINEGLNSELIEVEDGHVIAFRLVEHKASDAKPLEEVSGDIRNVLVVRKAAEQATVEGKKLFAELQSGSTLGKVASEHTLEVISHGDLKRDDNRVPFTIMQRAFKLPHPEADKVSVDGIEMPDGTYVLLELAKVTEGTAEMNDEQVAQLSQRVNYGSREFDAVIEAIRQASDVQIFEDNL